MNFQKFGAKYFGETKIEFDVGKMSSKSEDPDNFVASVKELYEFLTSPGTEVTNLIFLKDDVVWVSWKHYEDNITAGKTLTCQLLPT
jgi:hypothetical protein